jgi:hypothetical protein
VPVTLPAEARQLGTEQGLIVIADDFDGPLPDELLKALEG